MQTAFSDEASYDLGSPVFKCTKEVNISRNISAVAGTFPSLPRKALTCTLDRT
ncbi:MAG: hypothetical protein ACJ795_12520 [Ktedonobacteraceae bacterium]